MFNKRIKSILVCLLLLFTTGSLFAVEEYVSNIYKQIDHIFIIKSEDDLNKVLSNNNGDKYYYLIENYTEKKIRRLIVNNDYDFAMTAIVVVIENNLDNEQAVEMYSVIAEAYQVQQQYEEEQAKQVALEKARVEKEKEKQRGAVDKEYVSSKTTTEGKSVYVSGKETKLTSYHWKAAFGMADLLFLMDQKSGINSLHYGIALDGRYEYTLENKLTVGGDIFAGVQFISLEEDEKKLVPLVGELEGAFKFATPVIAKDLFFRFGIGEMITGKSDKAVLTKDIAESMFTPLVGVEFERIKLGNMKLDLGADWYAGHLFYKNINFAMGAAANLEIPFAEMEKARLNINIGVRDKFLMKENGIENRASVIFAIGAENVIR